MLQFAREVGTEIPTELARDVGALDAILTKKGLRSVSELPRTLLNDESSISEVKPTESAAELVLRVHGGLSRAIEPATPLTLQATQPRDGRRGVFARMPRIVKLAAVTAVVSALVFIVSAAQIATSAVDAKARTQTQAKPAENTK